MPKPEWTIERLAEHHNRDEFDRGKPPLSGWLKQQAGQYAKRDLARVYVAVRTGESRVGGYYSISTCHLRGEDLPPAPKKRLPARIDILGALIGKLAVDQSLHGHGLGGVLLVDALRRIAHLADEIGIRLVVVDAIDDDACGFYRHHGFEPFLDDPRRSYLTLTAIRALDS